MVKKVVLGVLLAGLIGILVTGAVIRTIDKTENVVEARGLEGRGNGRAVEGSGELLDVTYTGRGRGGNGQGGGNGQAGGGGNGQAGGSVERQYPNYESEPEAWALYEGTVVQSQAEGDELVLRTIDGEEIVVGAGPGYMEAQGFALQAGEQVQIEGYWEDGEFKAARVTRLSDGQSLTLRDEVGRPAWAGGGQRATELQATASQASRGQGAGQGGYSGEGNSQAPGDGTGTGQAQVEAWLTLDGKVVSVDSAALVVLTTDGQELLIDGRTWRFAQEQGFWASAGDAVKLLGFYEDGEFEVGEISDTASGQRVLIRDETGRPRWAGQGQRGS
jgi:hypothetical protein